MGKIAKFMRVVWNPYIEKLHLMKLRTDCWNETTSSVKRSPDYEPPRSELAKMSSLVVYLALTIFAQIVSSDW